ncbi:MAG: hypothetical protein H0T42_28055 [Deltaproteobacteria bacterium]|nr:hypothetical protein [Deltaproteobacteria bacterium]
MKQVACAIAMLIVLVTSGSAIADDFFSTSPGQLAASHAALDNANQCNDCHVDGTNAVSDQKCLACHDHKDLGARINAGKGFHASSGVKSKSCKTCHGEHKGRRFDIMGWSSQAGGEKGFNHDLTGWKLNGKHASTDCAECHKTKNKAGLKTYMGTDTLCGSSGCHATDQPHKFERKDMLRCERCHTESVWKPEKRQLQFNHDDRKDAAMPILGSHRDVACTKCHAKAVFNMAAADPDSCGNSGCHQSVHDGHLFGARECEWCHSPTFKSFKQQYAKDMPFFDHSERTRFDLGAHKKIKCYDCHTKALGNAKPVGTCEKCHAKDNKHGTRFNAFGGSPPACATCHPTTVWKPTAFNHTSRTSFKLTAKHAQAACRSCHRGKGPADFELLTGLVKGKSIDCMGCHEHKNAHDKKFNNGQCFGGSGCHVDAGDPRTNTESMVKVYHGPKSTFPLVKGHKDVPCADCHTGRKKNKTTFESIPVSCSANTKCHEDSLHKGTLSDKCELCHSPGTWDALRFDHQEPFPKPHKGELDAYPLKGAHKDNKCESCHPTREYVEANTTCSSEGCHADDDAHKGRLGKECEKCHVETGDNTFNHNTMSKFRIDGGHLQVRCADCHPSVTFKPRPVDCFGCHPEPAVHKGQYGTACEQCHSTRTWEDIKPLHDVGDFSLKGAHNNVACERCHRDNRPLAGSGNLCINCHRQDDIHSNGLSPRCGECHTQWSFTPARFDHSRVGCNLTGVHRTIACFDCHRNGNFSVIAPMCVNCHRDDSVRRAARLPDPQNHAARLDCAGCHNPNVWAQAIAAGSGIGRESVCR